MKKQIILLSLLVVFCSCSKKEKLIIGGTGWNQIAIVDKSSGSIEWKHALEDGDECNDLEVTPNGDILYAYSKGARLINKKGNIIWDYKANKGEELHTATRLESGNFMVGLNGDPARIVELDKEGKVIKEITYNTSIFNVRNQFRQIQKTPQNTYLIPLLGKHKVVEINETGQVLRSVYTGGTPFSVKLLNNGNWLVSGGEGGFFREVNPQTKERIQNIDTESLNWGSLLFVGEAIRYDNGNTLVANWNGISNDKSQPLLLELDSMNKVVWRLPLNLEIENITAVYSFFE